MRTNASGGSGAFAAAVITIFAPKLRNSLCSFASRSAYKVNSAVATPAETVIAIRADTLRALRCTSDRRNIPVRLSVAIRRPLAKWPKAPYEAQPVSKVYFPQSPPPEQQAPIRQDNPGSL